MTLGEELIPHIRAGFSGIWIRSDEHDEAVLEILSEAQKRNGWSVHCFDFAQGLTLWNESAKSWTSVSPRAETETATLINAINKFKQASGRPEDNKFSLLMLRNIHLLFQNAMNRATLFAALLTALHSGKMSGNAYLCLSPMSQLPPELEKQFVILDHKLPDSKQIETIIRAVATNEGDIESPEMLAASVAAAAGCTRTTTENAAALSLIREKKISPTIIWDVKAQALRKSGALSIYNSTRGFADGVLGYDSLKDFTTRIMGRADQTEHKARGIVLVGPPGVGKSEFAKALGYETKRKTVILDPGALRGKYLGESEERTRVALATVDAMGKIVLMIDEINLAMESGGGETDGGVGAHIMASMLTWMNDRQGDAFVVVTCNEIGGLPAAFTRAERFDALFFVDLPSREAKLKIWQLYMRYFGIIAADATTAPDDLPDDTDWSGAEIRACCRLAHLLQVPLDEAAAFVVPASQTSREQLNALRDWSANRCLSAETGRPYNPAETGRATATNRRRAVSR